MITSLEKLVREVLENAGKATQRPWKVDYGNWQIEQEKSRDGICTFSHEDRDCADGSINRVNPCDDAEYIVIAANNAERLAYVVRVLEKALIDIAEHQRVLGSMEINYKNYSVHLVERALEQARQIIEWKNET